LGVGTVVGRERELAAVESFFSDSSAGGRGLLVEGPAGIGKTAVWRAGIAGAERRGRIVLTGVAEQAESELSFVGLGDLLSDHVDASVRSLPTPQRRALEFALLRTEPEGAPPGQRAIAQGFLNVLRDLSARRPLVIAVDDLQWLDRPSADVLAFAARRLGEENVAFFLTRRVGTESVLDRSVSPLAWDVLELGPLSIGASRRLLLERLGLSLPRRVVRQLFDATEGNPLFLLEVARTLVGREPPRIGEEMPIPERVDDLLGTRVAELPVYERRLLLALALSGDMPHSRLGEVADAAAIQGSVRAGLVVVDGDRLRPAHPLLAAAALSASSEEERRTVRLELASITAGASRARHLALAADGPDDALAAEVASEAAEASRRGATQEAVILAEHALRLTPAASNERSERVLALAEAQLVAGELEQTRRLLSSELDALPHGRASARACLLLSDSTLRVDECVPYFERALAESENDPAMHAFVLTEMANAIGVIAVERVAEAEAWVLRALPVARAAGPDFERDALHMLAWTRVLRGRPIEDLRIRFRSLSGSTVRISISPERVAGRRFCWRGEVDRARDVLVALLTDADERGEWMAYVQLVIHVCELELRVGELDAVAARLDDWADSEGEMVLGPMYERTRALLAAGRGDPDEAERWAGEAIALAEESGTAWSRLEALRARGIAGLVARDPERAAANLCPVWQHTEREGVEEPGVFPVAPDLVEALTELGELDEARAVTSRLRELSERQHHPWGLATTRRCEGIVRLSSTVYDDGGAAELEGAAADYERLGLRFDRARSLLALGRAQRRHRKWRAARESLGRAATAFDELGSPGWAEQARSELGRVGGRQPARSGELTEAERRVVELAADGLSNKEIARALFVTVNTVEQHLSHAYAKLGVHSRGQLARRLSA
jgi:DNA-binding CsgD family transcriptional regulator